MNFVNNTNLNRWVRWFRLTCIFMLTVTHHAISQAQPTLNDQTPQNKGVIAAVTLDKARQLANEGRAESARESIPRFELARKLYLELGDKTKEADCLQWLGNVTKLLGENAKALEYYDQALSLHRQIDDKKGESTDLQYIGGVYYALGQIAKALEYFNLALPLSRQVVDKEGESNTLSGIAVIYDVLGEKAKAIDHLNQALRLVANSGNESEASILYNIGTIYSKSGEQGKALDHYNRALVILKKINANEGVGYTLTGMANAFFALGEYRKAIDSHDQALQVRKKIGDKRGEAATLSNMGAVYSALGEDTRALEYYNEALKGWRQADDKLGEAQTLNNIGQVHRELGDQEKAMAHYEQALKLRKDGGDKQGEAYTLNSIGGVLADAGEHAKALAVYSQAVGLYLDANDKQGEATSLINMGSACLHLGENEKANALEFFTLALPITKQIGDKSLEATTLNNFMVFWERRGNSRLAAFYGKQAVGKYQDLRENARGLDKETQQRFLQKVSDSYRYLANLLIANGRFSEAQQALNLFKDQQFFDFDRGPSQMVKHLFKTRREVDLAARFESVIEKLGNINAQFDNLIGSVGSRQPSSDEIQSYRRLEDHKKVSTAEYRALLKQAEGAFASPADENDKIGRISDTVEMQTELGNLNQQTGQKAVAVYTLVGENDFRALIVSPDGIKAFSTPVKGTELNDKVLKLWVLLQSDKYDTTVLSRQIYDHVFAPIEKELPKDSTTIIWSLDGNLRYIPIGALFDGKKFLAERYRHVIFTRADGERMTRTVNPVWTGAAFGGSRAQTIDLLGDGNNVIFPALPGVTQELRSIFREDNKGPGILSGNVLSDQQFTKTAFYDSLKQQKPLVHISSHFAFRPGDDSRSFPALGDGFLTLNELKKKSDLFKGVELLTLSACNTAATQPDANGKEIDGFAELAQRLGAGAVLATLWQVSDASTPWLMRDFYATRQAKAGTTKAEALQKAQLGLLSGTAKIELSGTTTKGSPFSNVKIVITPDGKPNGATRGAKVVSISEKDAPLFKKDTKKPYAHPYYWAPFVLIGNWR